MSNFKKFNSSDNNGNYNSSYVGREGELTWDPSNGLRLHDGNTQGGNSVGGGFSGNYSDLSNRPSGNTAVHDLIGSGSSLNTGKFLQQTGNGTSDWISLPTVYESLTISDISSGLGPASGSSASSSGAMSYGGQNAQFDPGSFLTGNLSSIQPGWTVADGLGWTATITQINAYGYQGMLVLDTDQNWTGVGPYYFYGTDYVAPVPTDLTLTVDTNNWVFKTNGKLQLPAGGDIVDSNGVSVLAGGSSVNEGADIRDYGAEANAGAGNITIDNLNYKRHWLLNINGNPGAGLVYVLGNGNEGDVIYFMPGNQFKPDQNLLQVSNYGYYNSTNSRFEFRSGTVQLFSTASGNTETVVRATWSYNAWHFSGPVTTVS